MQRLVARFRGRAGVLWCICAALVLVGCDDGPPDDAAPQDAAPQDATVAHDLQPEPVPDVEPPDVLEPVDVEPDPEPEPEPDAATPQPCAAPDAVISDALPLEARARRVTLPGLAMQSRLAPDCGGDPLALTAGSEFGVRIVPDVDGEHLLVAGGLFTALYRATPCVEGEPARITGCEAFEGPSEDGVTHGIRVELRAGQAFDIVADAPANRRAGPLAIELYPPVPEGGDCSLIGDSRIRPSCTAQSTCIDDRCVYVGPPRFDRLQAWSDRQSLRIEAQVAGDRLVDALWATADEGEPLQLFLTAVDERPGSQIFRGYIEEPALASSNTVDVEIVDAAGRKSRRTIAVTKLDPLPAGSPCDAQGIRDTCAPGAACIEGECHAASIGAWLTDAGLNLGVRLPDVPPNEPRVAAAIRPLNAERWSPLPQTPAESGRRWAAAALELPVDGLALRLHVEGMPPGLPTVLEPIPQPVRELDERCDVEAFADRCAAALACFPAERGGRCIAIDPPEIERLQAWAGADALGLKVTYSDPQNDTAAYNFAVFSAEGDLRFATLEPRLLPDNANGVFVDSMPAPWGPVRGDVLELQLIDATGQTSEADSTRLGVPPVVDLNVRCDPLGASAVCADDDTICAADAVDGQPVCQRFDSACPERWRPFPLDAPTRHDDNSANGPNRTAGACGGADTPEAIYEVEPEEDARWRISVLPPGATVYIRTHCRFAVPEQSELACARTPIELDVQGGETYYIFVDGPGDGGRFALSIDEVQGPVGPPGPEPVD